MKKKYSLLFFILICLTSCNDVSDFLFETDQNLSVRSVSNGAIYKGGESFPLTLSYDREISPEQLKVSIFDNQGISWGDTLIELPQTEEEYTTFLTIPEELPQGKYIFYISVYENDLEIASEEIIIFKTDSDYRIDQLYSQPHETEAEKDVFIKADIISPDDSDPFLRWSLDNSVIKEGYLSENLDSLHWLSAEDNGLYLITLEVFPEYCDSSYSSSVFASTEIVVSDMSLHEADNFSPDSNYSLLFHFSGDPLPVNESDFLITGSETLQFESFGNNLGYSFSDTSSMKVIGNILPSDSGEITPFSINGRGALFESISSGNLLRIDDGEKEILSLGVDESGFLVFSVNNNESRSLYTLTNHMDFTLSVIPAKSGISVRWFYNGNPGGSDLLETNFRTVSEEQQAVFGSVEGIAGASMFLDEFGIFVGDDDLSTIDADQYTRSKEYLFGSDLVAAEGYDGINKKNIIQDGSLVVAPGESVLLEKFSKSIKDTQIVISFSSTQVMEDQSFEVYAADAEGQKLFSLTNEDILRETDEITGSMSGKGRFLLVTEEGISKVIIGNMDGLSRDLESIRSGDPLSLFLETNTENDASLFVDSFLIFTNSETDDTEISLAGDQAEKLL